MSDNTDDGETVDGVNNTDATGETGYLGDIAKCFSLHSRLMAYRKFQRLPITGELSMTAKDNFEAIGDVSFYWF